MNNLLKGNAWRYGDDIDTDAIIPARYLNTSDPEELALHCMEDADPDFPTNVAPGDVIVGLKNFGCGSSREHAPIAIKAAGVSCVIAGSFARIFYRNAFNMGLPIFESAEAAKGISTGDKVEVDPATGVIKNLSTGKEYNAEPFPPFMMDLIKAGGLIPFLLKEQTHG
jgi:3-isopropylmalate/(R)-2-methylmalate dehydratase small subunit